MNWGAHKADVRIAAKNSVSVRAALRTSINAKTIWAAYQETHPFVTDNITQDRARARAWAMLHVKINTEPIEAALKKVYTDGFLLGLDASKEAIAQAEKLHNKAALTKSEPSDYIDWANWKPGNRAAALQYRPTGAFKTILDNAGIVSKAIAKAGYDRIGTALADSVAAGFSPARAAKVLTEKIGDPARALTIAITEQNRAMSLAAMQNYKENGVEKVEWSGANPCDICAPNEGQVVETGQEFNSGDTEPPVHPNCRCAVLPVIDEAFYAEPSTTDGLDLMPMEEEAGTPSQITEEEIDAKLSEFTRLMPEGTNIKDAISARGWEGERNYDRLKAALAKKYESEGMGATTAKTQARIDIGRAMYYLENKDTRADWYEGKERLVKEGWPQDAQNLDKGLATATKVITDAMKGGKITIALTEDNLGQVLQDGKWKNQFETKTSGGLLDPTIRKVGEGLSMNLPAGTPPKTRPIYGYITTNSSNATYSVSASVEEKWSNITSINSYNVSQYGELRVILNDSVRENTTVTIGDSLRTGVLADKITASNPNLTQMGLYSKGAPYHMGGEPTASYIEAQITGGVKTSDIAAIHAPSNAVQRVTEMLQQAGINVPVYPMGGTP